MSSDQAVSSPALGISARMHGLALSDILHMYHLGRSTVVLLLEGPVRGAIRLQDGEVIDARSGAFDGVRALSRLLSATEGWLETRPVTSEPARRSISASFQGALLEAFCLLDRDRDAASGNEPLAVAARHAESSESSERLARDEPERKKEENEMVDQAKLTASLVKLQQAVTGFIGASIVDLETGMTLAAHSARIDFDLAVASAYNSEMVKQKLKTIEALRLKTDFKDMLLTLGDQLHLIQLITPGSFVYLAADKNATNLAIMRNAVAGLVPEMR
jgi:hypothetical protein